MDALAQGFSTGGFHRREPVAECGGKDRHHLPVAEPRSLRRTFSNDAGSTQFLNGAPFLSAPGFLARTGT